MKEIKKQKHKTQIRVSGHEYTHADTGLCMQANYMRTNTSSLHSHVESIRTQTRQKHKNVEKQNRNLER